MYEFRYELPANSVTFFTINPPLEPFDCQSYPIYFIRPNLARVLHYLARAEHSNIHDSFHEMENFIPCAKD